MHFKIKNDYESFNIHVDMVIFEELMAQFERR